MSNWVGVITEGIWGKKNRGPYVRQEEVSPICTVYVDIAGFKRAKQDKCKYKIALLNEPPVLDADSFNYINNHKEDFDQVFTFNSGHDIEPECWVPHTEIHPKSKLVSCVFSHKGLDFALSSSSWSHQNKEKIGYPIRHDIVENFSDIIDVHGSITSSNILQDGRDGKEPGVKDYMYHVVVENMWNTTASEKINDAFAAGSVPIYWGDENSPVFKYYNKDGIILFKTMLELETILKTKISKTDYFERMPAIKENFKKAGKFAGERNLEFYLWDYLNLKKYMAKRED